VLLLGAGALVGWLRTSHEKPVTVKQAESRLPPSSAAGPGDTRPAPGVYLYAGSGTDHLSLPPLSQRQGPSMPGSVIRQGPNCWDLRIDYSTHHWQSWNYCIQNGDLVETGGQFWQLWPVGPVNFTNLTTLTCQPPRTVMRASATPPQTWPAHCTGTSTAVKGQMQSAGDYRFMDVVTLTVGGQSAKADHFVQTRTDSGSQAGTERYEVWLQEGSGLPLRMVQDIRVTTSTPFGKSTYTQSGELELTSLQPAG
jgi:hypothetical protein